MATDSNGLYYMRARYYNPDIKRFINQDIKVGDIGSSQSLNRYAYCEGNPVSMVDPFGLCGENTNDQGKKSKYQFWHNVLGVGGYFWDGFDLINGALYAAEGDYVNAAISFACGIPAVGNIIAGVAKASKAVKAIKTAEKIASACRTVGKIGNTAAGMKAMYDTYQTAQRECKTTGGKIAYMAGTLLAGYAMGKAAKWGAEKVKNLASKAMPKLKTAVKKAAGKLVSRFNKGLGTSGSGHMSRNRGFAINPFYKGEEIAESTAVIKKVIKPDFIVTPSGTVMDTSKNYNLIGTGEKGDWFQIHNFGKAEPGFGFPHTHKPQMNTDGIHVSFNRIVSDTSAEDIDHADKLLRNGIMIIRKGRR